MKKVKVKICGIRSLEAAKVAVAEKADFIGFNFVPSSGRYIDPEVCQRIINHIKGKTRIVGVFQNSLFSEVNRIALELGLDFVQLHGDENDDYIKQIKLPVIKSINGAQRVENVQAQFLLLDRIKQGQGRMVDFSFARDLAEKKDVFFAGGLTPENVANVIKRVKPFAVDVAGGIETRGREDQQKIKHFITNAKGVTI